MTKIIILGEQSKNVAKKPIEFLTTLRAMSSNDVSGTLVFSKPCDWNYIELVSKDYSPNIDLMFAYNDATERNNGTLFIGRWNDGVITNLI